MELQVSAKLESAIQVKTFSQFQSYRYLSDIPILYLCLDFLVQIKAQSLFHPSRYFLRCPVQTNMKSKIQVQTASLCTTMELKFPSTIQTIRRLCLTMDLFTILCTSSNAYPLWIRFLVIISNKFSSYINLFKV